MMLLNVGDMRLKCKINYKVYNSYVLFANGQVNIDHVLPCLVVRLKSMDHGWTDGPNRPQLLQQWHVVSWRPEAAVHLVVGDAVLEGLEVDVRRELRSGSVSR